MAITEELGYSKVCSCWIPQMVTAAHKEMKKATVTDILHLYDTGGDSFLSLLLIRDEI